MIVFLGDGPQQTTSLLRKITESNPRSCVPHSRPQDCDVYNAKVSAITDYSWTIEDTDLIAEFLRNPYWRRMWIVQEVYAARKLEVMFNKELYDEILLHRIVSIRSSVMNTPLWFPLPLTILIRQPTSQWTWDLWTLLTFTRVFSTSDARDRVIAILGIAEGIDAPLKEVLADYDCGADHLYQKLTLFFFLEVIGMHLRKAFSDKQSLGLVLDSSYLQESTEKKNSPTHILQTQTAKHWTLERRTIVPHPNSRIVMISNTLSHSEFEHLWLRCHDWLDPDLPFADSLKVCSVIDLLLAS